MKSTKEIEEVILQKRNEREKLRKKYITPINDELNILEEKRLNSIIENKEYLTDLKEYIGKEIHFTAINRSGEEIWLPTDEIVDVDKNGRLYLSSLNGGIVRWSEEEKVYIHYYHFSTKKLDILGFIDIRVEE